MTRIARASSNCADVVRRVMSPVCTTNDGRDACALIAFTAILQRSGDIRNGRLVEKPGCGAVADLHELDDAGSSRDGPAVQAVLRHPTV